MYWFAARRKLMNKQRICIARKQIWNTRCATGLFPIQNCGTYLILDRFKSFSNLWKHNICHRFALSAKQKHYTVFPRSQLISVIIENEQRQVKTTRDPKVLYKVLTFLPPFQILLLNFPLQEKYNYVVLFINWV